MDVWTHPLDDTSDYKDGTVVPHRHFQVLLEGKPVGEVEVHLHRRHGPDGVPDVSVGVTAVVYGPPNPGSDTW